MITPFTFRALSPHHATAMDLDYLLRVVEAARKYGFNAIQICGDTHGDGNLDGITECVRFAKANSVKDLDHVRRVRSILQKTCQAAHQFEMAVYFWHHELWYPERLAEVYPSWFVPAPENRFTRDLAVADGRVPRVEPDAPFWEFMDAKFDEAFDQCPDLDGTIMTIQESRVPVYCLHDDFERQVGALVDLYQRLEAAHRRVGRKWIVRTFAWREHEYRVVTEAIKRWQSPVPVESKGVPMDWSLYYVYDPLLGDFDGMPKHVELAPSCEFHGCTRHPVGHPWFYTANLRFAAERGHTGAGARMDRAEVSMLGGPDEGVLACIGRWLNDPEGTDVGEVYVDWLAERYGLDRGHASRLLVDVLERCWEATLRTYHNDKIYIGDSFGLGYDRHFLVAERHCCVEYGEPEPLAEKGQAVEFADQAAAALEQLSDAFRPADYRDLSRRVRLLQLVARVFHALVAALVARQRQMYEPSDANRAGARSAVDALAAAGEHARLEFPELDAGPPDYWQGHRHLARRVDEFAAALRRDLAGLPKREIVAWRDAAALGANARHKDQPVHQPGPGPEHVGLAGVSGAHHVLVLFAGTEMCVRRPLVIRCGEWEHRFDIGQYAWFLAHDRFRRYEVALPAECFGPEGKCEIELVVPEPDRSPYLRELRLETETTP